MVRWRTGLVGRGNGLTMSDETNGDVSWKNVAAVTAVAAVAGAASWLVWRRVRGKTGKGTTILPGGEMYVGDRVNGEANGFGTASGPGGEMTGQWRNGYLIGHCHGRVADVNFVGEAFEPEGRKQPWKMTFMYPNGGVSGACEISCVLCF